MNQPNQPPDLRQQLADWLAELPDSQIHALLEASRSSALETVRRRLSDVMSELLLEQASEHLANRAEQPDPAPSNPAPSNPAPASAPEAPTAPALPPEALQTEIAALRQQLGANEQALAQLRPPPTDGTYAERASQTTKNMPPAMVNTGTTANTGNTVQAAAGEEPQPEAPEDRPEDRPESGEGYYLYGIVASDELPPPLRVALPGVDAHYPVYTLAHAGLRAIVSRVSLAAFGQEVLEQNMQDAAWLQQRVCRHQEILAALLNDQTDWPLLPLKFGTIYYSEQRVHALLAEQAPTFRSMLARLAGRQEWGVKAFCTLSALRERVATTSERAQRIKGQMEQASSGAAYFLKKRLGNVLVEETERVQDDIGHHSHALLSQHACAAVANATQTTGPHDPAEQMLLNGAYLVDHERVHAFRAALDTLAQTYADTGVTYALTGPWPPYNFSTPDTLPAEPAAATGVTLALDVSTPPPEPEPELEEGTAE